MSPYAQLVGLAERELELVRGGDIESLPAAIEQRARLAATLGERPPAGARADLERLQVVQQQIIVELTLAGAEIVRELGTLRRGRGAVDAYRFAAGQATGSVDGIA
jgi:hypothetical protein